ncbi:hypothetical protein DAPPUDRAFT_337261 [Daphnia pulex]|uniref:Uncharacterized protein n=1 Tax=Daphnia pulex TaxID=6669 RepID=E9I1B7_DAPPU|nr:hypothetical protein DAPPUDRAFT_337261 [Daphnia pulex]|eukprot:EFX62213.1 hypothetical protein DAPPUDRAFT_337261 [Daphnia pulex]
MVFFVVKIVEDDEIVVVPVHWFKLSDNICAWPIKDAAKRAEREEVFNLRWPRYDAKVISSHDAIEEGGLYFNVSLTELNKHSAEFVTKAGTRLAAKKKKVVD